MYTPAKLHGCKSRLKRSVSSVSHLGQLCPASHTCPPIRPHHEAPYTCPVQARGRLSHTALDRPGTQVGTFERHS